MNQTVRSRFTSPERDSFKPAPLRAPSNPVELSAFDIRTKMAVVRLRRRKWAQRDENGRSAGVGGSDNSPEMAAFCGLSPPMNAVKRMSRLGVLAERERFELSVRLIQALATPGYHGNCGRTCSQ
jgi:hypothetical protein